MINLKAFIQSPSDACSFYRGMGVLTRLENVNCELMNKSHFVKIGENVIPVKTTVNWNNIIDTDICFIQRPASKAEYMTICKIKDWNIPVWLDFDDDLLNIPESNPCHESYKKDRGWIIKCLEIADVITVTTKALKNEYDKYNKNVRIIPNAYNDYNLPMTEKYNEGSKIISWRGSRTHNEDILEYKGQMEEIAENYSDWSWYFIGGGEIINCLKKIKNKYQQNELDIIQYFKYLHAIKPAIHLVPLKNNKFNESKSNIAWIESTMTGAVCICPDLSEWQLTGMIPACGDYYNTFKTAYECFDLKEAWKSSYNYIKNNLLLSVVNKQREKIIKEIIKK